MPDPIQGITSTGGVDRRSPEQERERLRRLYRAGSRYEHDEEAETDDTVDISTEARKRADGTYHKTILEHIEDEG